MKLTKKILAILLCIATICSLFTIGISAKEENGKWVTIRGMSFNISNGPGTEEDCILVCNTKYDPDSFYNKADEYCEVKVFIPQNCAIEKCVSLIPNPDIYTSDEEIEFNYINKVEWNDKENVYYFQYEPNKNLSMLAVLKSMVSGIDNAGDGLLFGFIAIFSPFILIATKIEQKLFPKIHSEFFMTYNSTIH